VKKLRITVGDKVYEVTVEVLDEDHRPAATSPPPPPARTVSAAPASTPSPPAAPKPAAPAAAGAGDVISPLAGKIVAVDVKPGSEVEEGDQILTLEAMKMNTYVYAPVSGKVTEVLVSPGEGVEEGQLLLRIG
jgi:biotin carboxyl carrier protein